MSGLAGAQTTTTSAPSASPPGKSAVKVDMVPSLFVMNARGAGLQGQTLTLSGVARRTARRAYWYGAAAVSPSARRRIDVLWALIASRKPFSPDHRKAA